jgi:hypothetical protein
MKNDLIRNLKEKPSKNYNGRSLSAPPPSAPDASLPTARTPRQNPTLMPRNLIHDFHYTYIRTGPKKAPSVFTENSKDEILSEKVTRQKHLPP